MESLPKITDFSPVKYHGYMSPLAGFGIMNLSSIADYSNGFLQLRGDHIYLPVLPGTSGSKFNFQMTAKFPFQSSSKCSFAALEFSKSNGLVLQTVDKEKLRFFYFSFTSRLGTFWRIGPVWTLKFDIDSVKDEQITQIEVESGKGNVTVKISLSNNSEILHQEMTFKMNNLAMDSLLGIWLGIQQQYLINLTEIPKGCHFDIKEVVLRR